MLCLNKYQFVELIRLGIYEKYRITGNEIK